jgi:HSP20 family protein
VNSKTAELKVAKPSELQQSEIQKPLTPFEEMDRLFDYFLSRKWLSPFSFDLPERQLLNARFESRLPHVDVIDRENEIVIRSEIPGVDKKDIEVSMTDQTVTIKGSTHKDEKEEKGDYHRREISSGTFSRTLTLPCDVISAETKSSFKDGVLELTVPKSKAVKRHTIKI